MEVGSFEIKKACRCCGAIPKEGKSFMQLFETSQYKNVLPSELHEVLSILKFNENDDLPQQICDDCISTLTNIKAFHKRCEDTQQYFKSYITSTRGILETATDTDAPLSPAIKVTSCSKTVDDQLRRVEEIFGADENDSIVTSDNEVNIKVEDAIDNDCVAKGCSDVTRKSNEESDVNSLAHWQCEYFIVEDETLDVGKKEKKQLNYGTCPFCKRSFAKMIKHLHKCPKRDIEICKYCELLFETPTKLQEHIDETHPDGLLVCQICSATFDSSMERKFHIRKAHSLYRCEICDISLYSGYTLSLHNKRWHSEIVNRECKICNKILATDYLYDYHMKAHTTDKNYQCRHCGRGFMQLHHRTAHERIHTGEKPYLCESCGKTLRTNGAFKSHMEKHTDSALHSCKVCNAEFYSISGYRSHMRKHLEKKGPIVVKNRKRRRSDEVQVPAERPLYHCSICTKEFATLLSLDKHIQKHKEPRKYMCKICGCGFKRVEHLHGHELRVHLKQKNFACPECDKKFAAKFELTAHARVHNGKKPYKCRYCPATYKWHSAKQNHERTHTGERPYECHVCKDSFKTHPTLSIHLKQHSADEIKHAEVKILMNLEEPPDERQKQQAEIEREVLQEYPVEIFTTEIPDPAELLHNLPLELSTLGDLSLSVDS